MSSTVTDSHFNMWRAVTALAHADHVVQPSEIEFIQKKFERLPFSPEQKAQIEAELKKPADLSIVIPLVTDPSDRATLIHFGRLMVWSDGTLDEAEENLIALLRENAVEKNAIEAAIEGARTAAKAKSDEIMAELDAEEDEEVAELSLPWRWLYKLLD